MTLTKCARQNAPKTKTSAGWLGRMLLGALILIVIGRTANAIDASNEAASVKRFGSWEVIEFATPRALLYRIASVSINSSKSTLTFDLPPSCVPTPAIMNLDMGSYDSVMDNGVILVQYKVPGEAAAGIEVIKTQMSEDFAFLPFKSLTTKRLEKANSHGHLAIWFPGSGDGTVKRSGNMYFALDGFKLAYSNAMKSCRDNL